MVFSNAVTVLVSVVNILLRSLNMALIERVGLDTQSEKTSMIMQSVFVTSFINSGFILLLTNANFEFSVLKFIPLRNQYADFSMNWYLDIAPSLCQSMLIMAFFPYVEILTNVSLRALMRWFDSGFPWSRRASEFTTKKITVQQYVNLYSGPVYMMHFKYSSAMVQIFVSFMYGMALPVLIPIAMVGIFNLYLVERLCLAYYYRQPPMFDQKLNDAVLGILRFAPILMFVFGYWQIGNRQIFYNDPSELSSISSKSDPHHQLLDLNSVNPSHFVLVLLAAILTVSVAPGWLFDQAVKLRLLKRVEALNRELDVDEGLVHYLTALPGKEQKAWYANEIYLRG